MGSSSTAGTLNNEFDNTFDPAQVANGCSFGILANIYQGMTSGYPHGVSFTMVIPARDATYARAAALLQQELSGAGFKANLQEVPGADFLVDVYIKGEGDAVLSAQLTNGVDLANNYESLFEASGFQALKLGSVNPQMTALIQQAITSLSPGVEGPPMQKAAEPAIQQGLEVPLVFEPSIVAYNKQRVGGHVVAPSGSAGPIWQGSTSRSELARPRRANCRLPPRRGRLSIVRHRSRTIHIDGRHAITGPDDYEVTVLLAVVAFAMNRTFGHVNEIPWDGRDNLSTART